MSQFLVVLAPIPRESAAALHAIGVALLPGDAADAFVQRIVRTLEPALAAPDWWEVVDAPSRSGDALFVEAQGAACALAETRLGRALAALQPAALLLWYAGDCDDLPRASGLKATLESIESQLRVYEGEVYLRVGGFLAGFHSPDSGICIEGSRAGLKELSSCVRDARSISFQSAISRASPYEHSLARCDARDAAHATRVSIEEGDLVIRGSAESRRMLADNIDYLAAHSGHLHIEHHPEHVYLDPLSEPMVVELDSRAQI